MIHDLTPEQAAPQGEAERDISIRDLRHNVTVKFIWEH